MTAQKMDFFSKCDQIRSFLKKYLMENFIFCGVSDAAKTCSFKKKSETFHEMFSNNFRCIRRTLFTSIKSILRPQKSIQNPFKHLRLSAVFDNFLNTPLDLALN